MTMMILNLGGCPWTGGAEQVFGCLVTAIWGHNHNPLNLMAMHCYCYVYTEDVHVYKALHYPHIILS